MSFERAVEEIIQAAMARGEFQNLKGEGKPQDHSDYFSMPEEDRLANTVLKNSGFVPPEVELLKEMDALRGRLKLARSEAERRELTKQLDERTLAFNLLQEQKAAARRRARKMK
jgi:hypothetical protein